MISHSPCSRDELNDRMESELASRHESIVYLSSLRACGFEEQVLPTDAAGFCSELGSPHGYKSRALRCRSPFFGEFVMDGGTRLQAALFGITAGVAWVADDVFVTRRNGGLLVEGWVGRRVAAIPVRCDSGDTMRAIWEKLNEVAVDDSTPPVFPV